MRLLLSLLLACGGLPAEGVRAREELEAALETRDPAQVGPAARAAGPWQGRDPTLDRLLGDALANVLMRPDEGLSLLLANPAPEDAGWRAAQLAAAIRTEDGTEVSAARARAGLDALPLEEQPGRDVLAQVAAHALRHPDAPISRLDEVLADCLVADARPRVGRKPLDLPLPSNIIEAARALGASRVVMTRPEDRSDRDPLRYDTAPRCGDARLIEGDSLPDPLPPRAMVISASDGRTSVHLDIMMRDEQAWVFGASDPEQAARWIRAADLLSTRGADGVRTELGAGLAGTAFAVSGAAHAP